MLVGATDGIGLALAREYVGRGWRVCIVGRSQDKLDAARVSLEGAERGRVEVALGDVTDDAASRTAFSSALASLGGLDLLVYCAGVLERAETTAERITGAGPMLEVNVLGAIRFLELAAEHMTVQGRGRLAALGSVAGVRGRRGNPGYGASKAALHAYLDGSRHRLHRHGVGVTTVKPGFVRTRMLREDAPAFPPTISVDDAARRIANGIERGRDDFFVPWWWGAVALLLRALPASLHKRFAPA